MTTTTPAADAPLNKNETNEGGLSEMSRRGLALYDEKLRTILEPEHNGKVVAIHLDSGDYGLGRNSPEAMQDVRRRHPEGPLITRSVGPEFRHGLVARVVGAQVLRRQPKK